MYPSRHSNPNNFVFNSAGLSREADNSCSQQCGEHCDQAPITQAFEIDTGYFHCQEHRSFYPYLNYEVVQLQTTDRSVSMSTNTFYVLNFPIDQLSEHLIEEATQLNPHRIALCNPLSSESFIRNYSRILAMTLNILDHVASLKKITLCVDILNDELFSALRNQSHLREVEILLPSATTREGLDHIRAVLNRGYALAALLPDVEFFNIPLEIVDSFPVTVDYLTRIP